VQIFRNDGIWVHGMNTYRHNCDLGHFQGRGCIKLHYPVINLLEGDYYVSVGVWPDEYTSFISDVAYDVREMAFLFNVYSMRHHGAGITMMEASWEYLPPSSPPAIKSEVQMVRDGHLPQLPEGSPAFFDASPEDPPEDAEPPEDEAAAPAEG